MSWLRTALMAFLGLVCVPAAVQAAEAIRVLLYQDASEARISADAQLRVRAAGREVRLLSSPLHVLPRNGALEVNGENLGTDHLVVEELDRGLRVVARTPVPPVKARDELEPLPAVFTRLAASVGQKSARSQRRETEEPQGFLVGGELHLLSRSGGLWIVNRLGLEEYVSSVVPAEMSAAWHLEALKAQAVAARTYALYQKMIHPDRSYDVVATIRDQVYRGRVGTGGRVREAVKGTQGLALTYQERPILAAFSSTAAGPTEDAVHVWSVNLPYLKGVECPFDKGSPFYEWRSAFRLDFLELVLQEEGWKVGSIATVTPYAYSRSGRISRLRILHSEGELMLGGQDLRRVVGYRVIPSTQFTIETLGKEVVLRGYGAGHAVGLCQWGAKELAELGYPFDTILHYYYPHTELTGTYRLDPLPVSLP